MTDPNDERVWQAGLTEAFAQFERALRNEIKARVSGLKITQSQVDQAQRKGFDMAPNTAEIHNAAIDEALTAIDTAGRE